MKRFDGVIQSFKALGAALLKRPLFIAGICFGLGVSLCVAWRPPFWAWLPGIACGAASFALFRRFKPAFLLAIALCALGAGGLRAGMDYPGVYSWLPVQKTEVGLYGRAADASVETEAGTVLILDSASVQKGGETVALSGRVRLLVSGGQVEDDVYGRRVSARASVEIPDGARYPGGFDYRMYLLGQGIEYTASTRADALTISGKAAWYDPMLWASAVRQGIESASEALYPEQIRGVMTGILVGGHVGIETTDYQAFKDTGIAHVLSVSGLHVGFVVAGLVVLLSFIRVKKGLQWWILAGFLAVYSMVVGFVPSVLRASVMALVLLYGRMNGQRQDGLNALAVALMLVLLINPLDWFNAGLQLSFSAALGIILLYAPFVRMLRRLPKYIRESLAVCLSAQVGMLPVMITTFNSLSIIAVFANLLFIPLFGVLMALGFAGLLLFAIYPVLASPAAFAATKLAEGMLWGARALSGISFAAVNMVSWPLWLIAAWFMSLWLASPAGGLTRVRRVRAVGALAIAAGIILLAGRMCPQPLAIVMLDVGQAECIVVRTPDKKTYLVDCGAPVQNNPYQNSRITQYLLKSGINRVDGIIITHTHRDHIAELGVVTQVFSPDWVAFSPGSGASIDLHGAGRMTISGPAPVIDLGGGATAQAVSVPGREGNEASLMFVLRYGEFSMLFTGDAEKGQELETLGRLNQTDVLKVGHHGSETSTSRQLLSATKPSVALISVGENAYGLPDEETLTRLEAQGTDIYRTDVDGCIEIISDKDRFTVKSLAEPLRQRGDSS